MSQFQPALEYLLDNEDAGRHYEVGVDNNGGRVLAGINGKFWPEQVSEISALPRSSRASAVAAFYLAHYWNPLRIGGVSSQDVASRVLDQQVNGDNGCRLLQRAVNALEPRALIEDGLLGPATFEAVNSIDEERLLAALRTVRVNFYEAVLALHPEDEPFRDGWLARARK